MILRLKHEPVGGGDSQFAAEIEEGRHVIGRDDVNSLILDMDSVSREHACFFEARGRWFFSDMGSTNGSWVNGNKAVADAYKLLRDGDVVQLANVALRVRLEDLDGRPVDADEAPSLYIFKDGDFQMEFPFSGTSSRLNFGDVQNYVSLADYERLPEMTITLRGGKLELVAAGETARIVFNGVEWGGAAGAGRTLYDRDELDTGSVKLVVCDSSTAKTVKERQIKAALATLPPAAGVASPSSSSPIHSLHSQSLNVEATNTLPKVSSQSEPSAAMGSGSGLFGGGRGANNPASSTEGRFGLGEGARDGDAGMWAQGRGGIGETDEVPETGAPGVPQNRQRSLYSGGAGGTEPRGFGTNRAPGEIGAAQRFGQPLPSEEEEVDEFAEMRRSRTQMLVGLAVLILVLIVVGVLISVIRGQ